MKEIKKILSKERLSAIGNAVKECSRVLLPVIGCAIYSQRGAIINALDGLRYSGEVGYDDAAKVIMDSDMMSSYKTAVFKLLRTGEDSEYYKAIIHVVKSDALSSHKVEMITEINNQK